jgi:hypothetical protein
VSIATHLTYGLLRVKQRVFLVDEDPKAVSK